MTDCPICDKKLSIFDGDAFGFRIDGKRVCKDCYHNSKAKKPKEPQYMGTITVIPRYEDMIKALSDWIGSEFKLEETAKSPFGIASAGTMDEQRISMLAPTPRNFAPPSKFEENTLVSLNVGVLEDGEPIVGLHKTVVKKKYVDGFVHALKDIYNVRWQEIRVLVHTESNYPIILYSNLWMFFVGPLFHVTKGLFGQITEGWGKFEWVKGKYDPETEKTHHGYSCKECAYSNGYLVDIPKLSFSGIVSGVADYETKERWVCNKFNLNLDERAGLAEKCTSYLTQKEYERKCLSGEMEPLKAHHIIECAYCGGSYDMIQHPSCPRCGAIQKKKLK